MPFRPLHPAIPHRARRVTPPLPALASSPASPHIYPVLCSGACRLYSAVPSSSTRTNQVDAPSPGGCLAQDLSGLFFTVEGTVQVFVRDNDINAALRVLKKKMQREGTFREMKRRRSYEKPSERRTREKAEAIRRTRKMLRKRLEREGY